MASPVDMNGNLPVSNGHAVGGVTTTIQNGVTPDASEDGNRDPLPVLIIGAGSAGLALAQGLRKNDIPAIVFERDPSLDPAARRRWGFAMAWSAPVLQSLIPEDMWDRIPTALSDPSLPVKEADSIPILNGATGDQVGTIPFPKIYRLYRPRFRELLSGGLDIRYDKVLLHFSATSRGTVAARFEDGNEVEGRLLVGADGARSRTRALLLSPARGYLTRLPFAATFVQARYSRERALFLRRLAHPVLNAMPHPENFVAMFGILNAPDPDKPEEWVFIMYIGWRVSPEEQDSVHAKMTKREHIEHVKKIAAAKFADPVKSAFAWLPDGGTQGGDNHPHDCCPESVSSGTAASSRIDDVYYASATNWDPRPPGHVWNNFRGLVTLAGDAAHPMTYHRGQGLNNAIDDVGHLVRLLSGSAGGADEDSGEDGGQRRRSQQQLIDEYEAEMRDRGGREVETSEATTWMMHNWTLMMNSPLVTRGLAKGDRASKGDNGKAA